MHFDITGFLNRAGIFSDSAVNNLSVLFTLVVVSLIALAVYLVARKWLSALVIKIAGRTETNWDDLMFDQKFFNRLAWLLFPIVLSIGLNGVAWSWSDGVQKFLGIWIVFAAVRLVGAVLSGANRIYESYPVSRNRPIKVFIQIVLLFMYCAAIIIAIQILTGKPVAVLLAGLTAFAAVLMLVFKDTILGFVAGIQLIVNDMVRIGDWIVMPSSNADGDVLEIGLTTVKVQNWDKTITTIPTYKMVEQPFINWRGMQESKGRRIKRSVNIDVNSIHYLTAGELEVLTQSALLKEYITGKMAEIDHYNEGKSAHLDQRRLTNIGTFREYLELWLKRHPHLNHNMTCMVRQLQPTPTGVPLEIYCFSALLKWVDYEDVQSDIFDHVFAIMEMFNLRSFQFSGTLPPPGPQTEP